MIGNDACDSSGGGRTENTEKAMERIVIPTSSRLYEQLERLAGQSQMVYFAGLPGTGKSLLIHQLAHLAAAQGRGVHLLQWDTARPVFEAHPASQQYPVQDGVTHAVIRKACGLWVRQALVRWHREHDRNDAFLIGETPLIGNRFMELAGIVSDAAETLLRQPTCVFVIPVPAPPIRQFIEVERQRRSTQPLHAHESQDAPPQVLRDLWQELVRIAPRLGVSTSRQQADTTFDPWLYQQVYATLLRYRHIQVMPLDLLLPTTSWSVYDFDIACAFLTPTADDVAHFIEAVERQYPDPQTLQCQMAHWYRV